MCAVSAVYDYGRREFPQWQSQSIKDQANIYNEFLKLLEAAKAFDKKANEPDCEDPTKAEVLQKILDRLDAIEERLK